MGYNPDVFQQQFPLVKFFVYHLTYYRQIRNLYDGTSFKSEFWKHTSDAHLLQAAIYWCMVFGTDGNSTHWKNLSCADDKEAWRNFRKGLIQETSLGDKIQWECYWEKIVYFRNEYAAHRNNFKGPIPKFDTALEVAFVYDRWVRKVISPDTFAEPPLDTTVSILKRKIYPLLQRLLQDTQEYNQDNYPL